MYNRYRTQHYFPTIVKLWTCFFLSDMYIMIGIVLNQIPVCFLVYPHQRAATLWRVVIENIEKTPPRTFYSLFLAIVLSFLQFTLRITVHFTTTYTKWDWNCVSDSNSCLWWVSYWRCYAAAHWPCSTLQWDQVIASLRSQCYEALDRYRIHQEIWTGLPGLE